MKWSQLLVTHTTHDMSRKYSYSTNYNFFFVVNPIQTVQRKLNNFQKVIECSDLRVTYKNLDFGRCLQLYNIA